MHQSWRKTENPVESVRCGLSHLDLLISVGIIGLLVSLVAPAVQQARESARQVVCTNNLQELAIAAQLHVSAHQAFPYTSTAWNDGERQHQPISPHRYLMASLDRVVYDQIDFQDPTMSSWGPSPPEFYSSSNRSISRLHVASLVCPSDMGAPGCTNYRANLGISVELLPPSPTIESISHCGAFANGHSVRPSQFVDGLSNTVLFSERATGDWSLESYDPFRDVFSGVGMDNYRTTDGMNRICRNSARTLPWSHFSFQGASWLLGGYSNTWYNHVRTPNSLDPDCAAGPSWTDGGPSIISARSLHSGAVNVMLADSAVKPISSTIDQRVWRALGTRKSPPDELIRD